MTSAKLLVPRAASATPVAHWPGRLVLVLFRRAALKSSEIVPYFFWLCKDFLVDTTPSPSWASRGAPQRVPSGRASQEAPSEAITAGRMTVRLFALVFDLPHLQAAAPPDGW